MQDAEIKKLRKRVKELECGIISVHRENDKLRRRMVKCVRRECELAGVNT